MLPFRGIITVRIFLLIRNIRELHWDFMEEEDDTKTSQILMKHITITCVLQANSPNCQNVTAMKPGIPYKGKQHIVWKWFLFFILFERDMEKRESGSTTLLCSFPNDFNNQAARAWPGWSLEPRVQSKSLRRLVERSSVAPQSLPFPETELQVESFDSN